MNEINNLLVWTMAWMIQEGDHENLRAGMRVEFALQFSMENEQYTKASSAKELSCVHRDHGYYELTARVLDKINGFLIIDFGLLAFSPGFYLKALEIGDTFQSIVCFLADENIYRNYSSEFSHLPKLQHDWLIQRVEKELIPWIPNADRKSPDDFAYVIDEKSRNLVQVDETDVGCDDSSTPYLLYCDRLV
jgi:hypothetical protein